MAFLLNFVFLVLEMVAVAGIKSYSPEIRKSLGKGRFTRSRKQKADSKPGHRSPTYNNKPTSLGETFEDACREFPVMRNNPKGLRTRYKVPSVAAFARRWKVTRSKVNRALEAVKGRRSIGISGKPPLLSHAMELALAKTIEVLIQAGYPPNKSDVQRFITEAIEGEDAWKGKPPDAVIHYDAVNRLLERFPMFSENRKPQGHSHKRSARCPDSGEGHLVV
jgi:hypothetical protein